MRASSEVAETHHGKILKVRTEHLKRGEMIFFRIGGIIARLSKERGRTNGASIYYYSMKKVYTQLTKKELGFHLYGRNSSRICSLSYQRALLIMSSDMLLKVLFLS